MSVIYIPRGPLMDWSDRQLVNRVLDDLEIFARNERAVFLKMDPEVITGRGVPGTENDEEDLTGTAIIDDLMSRKWVFSHDQIQFRNSVWLNLEKPLDEILAGFKQKTRYNIRLAERKEVTTRKGSASDFKQLYKLYAETSLRDGFAIRNSAYYSSLWEIFSNAGMLDILIADYHSQPVAALFLFHLRQNSWYLYGMSAQSERDRMPNHLLQWEAIKLAKALGCTRYDMWGAPDVFEPTDSMWGVYKFKEGFNGDVVRMIGAWDYVPNRLMYTVYTRLVPFLLNRLRAKGRKRVSQELAA